MMTRRSVLQTGGTIAFFGWWPFGSDEDDDDRDDDLKYDTNGIPEFPEHITARDDLGDLENYQPRLVVGSQQARHDMQGMYGWIAESEEHDVDAYYYWIRSNTQRSIFQHLFGLDIEFKDTHYLDHEPIIVFVNSDGTVDKVVYTAGHHLAAELDGEWGRLIEDRVADRRTHVVLRQVRPHNHFMEASSLEDGVWVQGFAEFDSWLDRRETWYRNGRYDNTANVAVMDPFEFYESDGRTFWWADGTTDAWLAKNVYVRRLTIGDERDELRFED